MAAVPNSPTTPTRTSTLGKKDKGGWMGTLTKKRQQSKKEVSELEDEGRNAIDGPTSPITEKTPDTFFLDEGQERFHVENKSYDDPKVKELCEALIDWINDVLATRRVVVKNIEEDLNDGQVLAMLVEKLANIDLGALTEVTQSVDLQKYKLGQLLEEINKLLALPLHGSQSWNVELIHSKYLPAILHLLVQLARQYNCPYRLPNNVIINVVVVQKRDGILRSKTVPEDITGNYNDREPKTERDAFDTLFDHAPEKLVVVKKSLQGFVNKHLSKLDLQIINLDTQFSDGVNFILLIGLLEGYFVPLHLFYMTPQSFDHKVHNVQFAMELVQDAGLQKPRIKPSDIVNGDLKSTLRVLYTLFTKYKNMK
ncbi:alpha-parvin-like [Hydractinia symbiolongicarpus]|uniref:alpha-parvin-like n=1 Tax=Hydractinia symbiolongicarpus TaxID=13093 RepID=UPI00254D7941|nr:alpha-parvin-like [Hydractinia symbiolongicarpus]